LYNKVWVENFFQRLGLPQPMEMIVGGPQLGRVDIFPDWSCFASVYLWEMGIHSSL